jgi:uncharacterized SAM-binding protein YcdF (DUF218 family)
MRLIVGAVVMPLVVFWLVVAVGAVLIVLRKRKAGGWVLLGAGIWLLVISTPFLPGELVAGLEKGVKPLDTNSIIPLEKHVDIIVLGAGHSDDPNLPANNQLSLNALGRLCEGIRLHRMIAGSKLVCSGYGGKLKKSQARILANAAMVLGVDSTDLLLSDKPENTFQEAREYKRLFGTDHQLIVVTDAIHLKRALLLFRGMGLNAIGAPTNHLIKHGTGRSSTWWFPSSGNIGRMESAVHEIIGLWVAKIEINRSSSK